MQQNIAWLKSQRGFTKVVGHEQWDELDAKAKLGMMNEMNWTRPKLFYRVGSCDELCM